MSSESKIETINLKAKNTGYSYRYKCECGIGEREIVSFGDRTKQELCKSVCENPFKCFKCGRIQNVIAFGTPPKNWAVVIK